MIDESSITRSEGILCAEPRAISPASAFTAAKRFHRAGAHAYRFGSLPLFSIDDTVCYRISSDLLSCGREKKNNGRGHARADEVTAQEMLINPQLRSHSFSSAFNSMRMPNDSSTLLMYREK